MKTPALNPAFLIAVGSLSLSPAQALTVNNFSEATNQRFPDNSNFIGDSFDLSGVGRAENGTWATAIGDNYFLSANHVRPATNSIITFSTDDGNSSFSHTVGGGFRLGTTDLWLGYTTTVIAPAVARYAVTTQDADSLSDLGLGSDTLYLSGDQVAGAAGTVADHVLGTNQAESFYEEGSGAFESPGGTLTLDVPSGFENDMIILFNNLTGDDNPALLHESVVQGGDSGSPLFSVSGNDLIILGTASLLLNDLPGNFVNTRGPDPLETRDASTYSYIGSYQSELAAAIALVPAATAIPEPSSVTLAFLALALGMRRKR